MFNPAALDFALIADIGGYSWLIVIVFIVTALGAFYGIKTRKGSGVNEHPGPDSGDPVVSEETEQTERRSDRDEGPGTEEERDSTLGQRGTK